VSTPEIDGGPILCVQCKSNEWSAEWLEAFYLRLTCLKCGAVFDFDQR
jgi:hypothetical protein